MDIPIIGHYRHYKGNEYEVTGTATHTETGEELVVYVAISDSSKTWVRPYGMFFESVTIDGKEIPRFEKLDK